MHLFLKSKKGPFKVNFHETLGMSVEESTREKFVPPTRGVVVDPPGSSLTNYSLGKKGNKKDK